VRLYEKNARITLEPSTGLGQADTAEIGSLEPYAHRRFTVRARVRSPYADRSELRAGASVHSRELGETPLGETTWRVDSHPAFSAQSSQFHLESEEVLRPNQLAGVAVRITNVGSDVAHNVRVRLYVSPEARLETVDGATREKSKLVFGEIAPGASAEARLGLRLLRSLAKEYPVQAVNWHDRTTSPSLREARSQFDGALVGGVERYTTLLQGDPQTVAAEVRDAIAQTGGGVGYIVSAGCVISIPTPESNIKAAIGTVMSRA